MPSLRHPVGPLPSAIYWRRRFVVLVVSLAALALVVWLAAGSGGGGSRTGAAPSAPASSIGPSSGGGGKSSDGSSGSPSAGSKASGGAGSGGSSGGSGGGSGDGSSGGVSVSGGAAGAGTGSGGSGSGSGGVPVNTGAVMALRPCAASDLELALDSARTVYPAGVNPVFRLTVKNTGGAACRIDVGRTSAVVAVSSASQQHVWSSADCPADKSAQWVELGAGGGTVTVSYNWGRTHSQPGCPSGSSGFIAGGGTFVAQAGLAGLSNQPQFQFRLVAAGS